MKKLFAYTFVCLGLVACRTLPNLQPFASQTATLHTALAQSYTNTEAYYRGLDTLKPLAQDALSAQTLRKHWQPTQESMKAMVAYTQALANLADAGKNNSTSVGVFLKSLNGLLSETGFTSPLTGLPLKASQVLIGKLSEIKAQSDLRKAVYAAQPIVAEVVARIDSNLNALANINDGVYNLSASALFKQNDSFARYYEVNRELVNTKYIPELTAIGQYYQKGGDSTFLKNLVRAKKIKVALPQEDLVAQRQTDLLTKMGQYRAEMQAFEPYYQAYQARKGHLLLLQTNNKALISKTQQGLKAWLKAHQEASEALNKKHQPNLAELMGIAQEIGALVENR